MVEINKSMDEVNASAKSSKTATAAKPRKVGCELCMWWHPGNHSKPKQCLKFGPVPDEFAENPIDCPEYEDDIPF